MVRRSDITGAQERVNDDIPGRLTIENKW